MPRNKSSSIRRSSRPKAQVRANGKSESANGLMTSATLRRQIRQRVNALSCENLSLADDFLALLEERESNDATEELLRIPGFTARLKRAEREVAQGQLTPFAVLKRRQSR